MGSEGRRQPPPRKLTPPAPREPSCPQGYTATDLDEIFPTADEMKDFNLWMRGQTVSICIGAAWDYETERYEPDNCFNNSHGPVVYESDVRTYVAGHPPLD